MPLVPMSNIFRMFSFPSFGKEKKKIFLTAACVITAKNEQRLAFSPAFFKKGTSCLYFLQRKTDGFSMVKKKNRNRSKYNNSYEYPYKIESL